LFADERLLYRAIAGVAREQRAVKKRQGLSLSADQTTAFLSIDGKTDVTLQFAAPQPLRGFPRLAGRVTTFCLAVDDPKRFVVALRAEVERSAARNVVGVEVDRGDDWSRGQISFSSRKGWGNDAD